MASIRHHKLTFCLLWLNTFCHAWVSNLVIPTTPLPRTFVQRLEPLLFSTKTQKDEKDETAASEASSGNSSAGTAAPIVASETSSEEEEDDDDEYEFIEYEMLTEEDYLGSEWRIGTLWENNANNIKETWVRLKIKGDKNFAEWGDDCQGTWSLDAASQFLTISKNFYWGKRIWAGVVDDYYFTQGTVRGWTYLTPASVLGQWQGKRLGVDTEEAGTPPWFEMAEEDEEDEESKGEESTGEETDEAEPKE